MIAEFSSAFRTLNYSGVVRPRIESAIGFRVSGKLIERLVNAGDAVASGQTLARIGPIDLQLSEAAQQANVEAAKTRAAVAKAALERARACLPVITSLKPPMTAPSWKLTARKARSMPRRRNCGSIAINPLTPN